MAAPGTLLVLALVVLLPLLSTAAPTAPTATNPTTTRAFTNEGFITEYTGADFDGGDQNPVLRRHALAFYTEKQRGTGCVWKYIDRQGADLLRVRIDVSSEMPMAVSMSYDGKPLIDGVQMVNNEVEMYPAKLPEDAADEGLFKVCVEESSAYCCVGGAYVEVRRLALRKQLS